jgi:tRNA(Ile)-lysidine synthase
MCFGAVLQTRLARVVYGADNPREGALGGVLDLRDGDWKRRPEVRSGVLARDAARLMSAFFRRRRPPST